MTTLSPELLRNVILVASFRGGDLDRCCAGFLLILLAGDADAGVIPGELCTNSQTGEFDPHLAGMACASLRAQGLIVGVDRVKSSSPLANGRKVTLWHVPDTKVGTVRTWMVRHGYADAEAPTQTELFA